MRLGFTPTDADPQLPNVHTDDSISALAQARLPLMYRDAGAFDRREFLARQNIDVVAMLRASKLLAAVSTPPPTFETRLARLRHQVDELFPEAPKTAGILRAMLLRTDQDGAVQVQTDRHSLSVSCFVACPMSSKPTDSAQIPNNQQPDE
jgi:hypothetical protein